MYGAYGVLDVATETFEVKSTHNSGEFLDTYKLQQVKVMPYNTSNGKSVVLTSIKYSDHITGASFADYARIYDEATGNFTNSSQKCYYNLAQTSVGDYTTNSSGHLVKYNTITNDFEEVPEINNVAMGVLLDYVETDDYIYFIGSIYIAYYNKSTGTHGNVLDVSGGIVLPSISGNKYVSNTAQTAFNPTTDYIFNLEGYAYSIVPHNNKAKTVGAFFDKHSKHILIS